METARLLADLDPDQRRAVTETTHPLCIIAGAGSGKTRVLTRRIAYRVAVGTADPRHVLALTPIVGMRRPGSYFRARSMGRDTDSKKSLAGMRPAASARSTTETA